MSYSTYLTSPGTATMATDPIVMIWTSTISGCHGSGQFIWEQTVSRYRIYGKWSRHYFVLTCSHLSSAKENGFGLLAILNFFGRFTQDGVSNTIPEWISFSCPCRYQIQNKKKISDIPNAYRNNMSKIKTSANILKERDSHELIWWANLKLFALKLSSCLFFLLSVVCFRE